MDPAMTSSQRAALRVCALGLLAGSIYVAAPLWVALVLGAWFALLARPLLLRLGWALRGRHGAAAVLVLLLLVVIIGPLTLALVSLISDALDFARRVLSSPDGKDALRTLVSEGGERWSWRAQDLLPLIEQHGSRALRVLGTVAGATVRAGIGLFVFLLTSYTLLVDGPQAYGWLAERLPLHVAHTRRLADAFNEAGRGLVVGVGLTALVQGVLASTVYLVLGLPSALTLGLLTCLAALVPGVGTALVWVPVAAGLALSGRWIAALVLVAVGVLVISTMDNVLRPVLTRYGRLRMPTYVLFVAIFGGLLAFGAWGFVLGPLIVRLCMEALEIWKETEAPSLVP